MLGNEEERFIENFENVSWEQSKSTSFKDVEQDFKNELQKQATKKYSPIGTVVSIKGFEDKYMIMGFNYINDNSERFDYVACPYPMGLSDSTNLINFNHNDITSFYYVGYFDTFGRAYQEKLNTGGEKTI